MDEVIGLKGIDDLIGFFRVGEASGNSAVMVSDDSDEDFEPPRRFRVPATTS